MQIVCYFVLNILNIGIFQWCVHILTDYENGQLLPLWKTRLIVGQIAF